MIQQFSHSIWSTLQVVYLLLFAVLVDTTAPIAGAVSDGRNGLQDIRFIYDTSTVMVSWESFTDHESGIHKYDIDILVNDVVVKSHVIQPNDTSLSSHSFHLQHMDKVLTHYLIVT